MDIKVNNQDLSVGLALLKRGRKRSSVLPRVFWALKNAQESIEIARSELFEINSRAFNEGVVADKLREAQLELDRVIVKIIRYAYTNE